LLLAFPFLAKPGDDLEAAAQTVLKDFFRARERRNLDDLMKTVDVPWYHDGKSVITDRKELAQEFHGLLARKGQSKADYQVRRLLPYRLLKDRFTADERRMIDSVLTDEDRIALVTVRPAGTDQESTMLLFVRLRNGQAKVVGIRN
jgi:hypothetical protein